MVRGYPAPVDIEVADIDSDGRRDDVVTANAETGNISVLISGGASRTTALLSQCPSLQIASDLRSITTGSFNPNRHSYHRASGDDPVWFRNQFSSGDPSVDVAVVSESEDMAFVLLNRTTGQNAGAVVAFTDGSTPADRPRRFAVGDQPQAIVARDVINIPKEGQGIETLVPAGSGALDLIVANKGSNDISLLVGMGMDRSLFNAGYRFAVGPSPRDVAIGRMKWLTAGGTPIFDIVTSNKENGTVTILQGSGRGGGKWIAARRPTERGVYGQSGSEFGGFGFQGLALTTGNFSGSAEVPDLFATAYATSVLEFGNPDSSWSTFEVSDGLLQTIDEAVMEDDRRVTNRAIAGNFNEPTGTLRADRLDWSLRNEVAYVAARIPPTKGQALLAISSPSQEGLFEANSEVHVLKPKTHPADTVSFDVGFGASSLVAGAILDDNGAGPDFHSLLVANAHDHSITVLLNVEDPNDAPARMLFPILPMASGGVEPRDVILADLTNDGKLDLFVANMESSTLTFFKGKKPATPTIVDSGTQPLPLLFRPPVVLASYAGEGPIALLAEDFDKDGVDDIAVANYRSDDVTVMIVDEALSTGALEPVFSSVARYPVVRAPVRLAWGEILGDDAYPEIVVANLLTSNVRPISQAFANHSQEPMSWSHDGRFILWSAAMTSTTPNLSAPSVKRQYLPVLFGLDRATWSNPKRLLPDEQVVDSVFRPAPDGEGARIVCLKKRLDRSDPGEENLDLMDPNRMVLIRAKVSE